MEELKVFENAEFGAVRTTTVNGEIMFVGKDVAEILGYSNPRKAIIDHIDEEDKEEVIVNANELDRILNYIVKKQQVKIGNVL